MIRERATNVIYVGRVVDTFPDSDEFNFHYYLHQGGKSTFDANLPLEQRRLKPESAASLPPPG